MPLQPAVPDAGEPCHTGEIVRFCGTPRCLVSWEALMEDSDNPVVIGNSAGRYAYVNRAFAEILDAEPSQVIGSTLADWFDSDFAEERLRLRAHVLKCGRRVRSIDLVRGRRFLVIIHPVQGHPFDNCIMATLVPRPPRQDELERLYSLNHLDFGRLNSLSPREIEVLRLIGDGTSQREIGVQLHRTVKTIEAHRASLGRKLGVKKNIQLVQIAMQAGLLDPNMGGSSFWNLRTEQESDHGQDERPAAGHSDERLTGD